VRFLIEVEIARRLPGSVADDEAFGVLLDCPPLRSSPLRGSDRRSSATSHIITNEALPQTDDVYAKDGALITKVGGNFSFARHPAYPVSRRPPAPLDQSSSIQIFI
jgi:hypothetical protein